MSRGSSKLPEGAVCPYPEGSFREWLAIKLYKVYEWIEAKNERMEATSAGSSILGAHGGYEGAEEKKKAYEKGAYRNAKE